MTNRTALTAAAAAAALALIAGSGPALAKSTAAKPVACYGVNACKGQSDCKTAHNDCKGMNSCKGQGFKEMSKKACTAAGGSLNAPA
jgi:uncharacterized membrane protein